MIILNLTRYGLFIWVILFATFLIGCQEVDPRLTELPQIIAKVDLSPHAYGGEMAVNTQTDMIHFLAHRGRVGVLQETELITVVRKATGGGIDIAVDETDGWVYVINLYTDTVTILNETEIFTRVLLAGENPKDIMVDPVTGWVYVTHVKRNRTPNPEFPAGYDSSIEGRLTIIQEGHFIQSYSFGDFWPNHIILEPNSGYIYITEHYGEQIIVLDNLQEVTRFETEGSIITLDINTQTGDVYALTRKSIYHYKDTQLVGVIDIQRGPKEAYNLIVNPVNGYVYAIINRNEVVVVDNETILNHIFLPPALEKMAVDPINGNVYVSNLWFNKLTLIQGTQMITTYNVGGLPRDLAVNPINGRVYVATIVTNTITILGYPGVEARLKEEAAQPSFISPVSPVGQ